MTTMAHKAEGRRQTSEVCKQVLGCNYSFRKMWSVWRLGALSHPQSLKAHLIPSLHSSETSC